MTRTLREFRRLWQFKNGTLARFNNPRDVYGIRVYRAWDRSLAAWVYYEA